MIHVHIRWMIRLERSQLRFTETYGYGTEAVRQYETDKLLVILSNLSRLTKEHEMLKQKRINNHGDS